jgi:hypothetical protein
MDLKRLVTHFAYKIEPNPAGGFIARALDPSVSTLEAPTRDELQQKIRERALQALSSEFPALNRATEGKHVEVSFHVERQPDGGFSIHSADPNAPVIQTTDQKDFESKFLEKFLGFAGRHLMPELSQALAAQVGSANIKVLVNGKTSFRMNSSPYGITFGPPRTDAAQSGSAQMPNLSQAPATPSLGGTIGNIPLSPESSNTWKVFGVALLVAIVGGLVYFFFHYR